MKSSPIELPIIIGAELAGVPASRGGVASASDRITKALGESISNVKIDPATLRSSVTAAAALVDLIQDAIPPKSKVSLTELQLTFGVTGTGKVAFFGNGVDIQFATNFQVKFKVEHLIRTGLDAEGQQ